jgi:hypothetical protein
MKAFNAAMVAGVDPAPQVIDTGTGPFLHTTIQRSIAEEVAPSRGKYKAGYLRKGYSDEQLTTIYRHLSDPESKAGAESSVLLIPYGGKVNTVPPSATASVQRDVVAKMVLTATWEDPAADADNLAWARNLYRDLYRDTGGVPVPNEVNAGSYINYPDVDLADPEFNTSGVPWHQLYYGDNYPRLQRVKATWDPRNIFRHKLSIQPA